MTWLDYVKPPGTSWADPNVAGSVRTFRGALVLLDYPNQPFVVTLPKGSTVFGNPSAEANSSIWPNAGGGSSTQAESSGQAVFAHELSHILGIADNYNNPFGIPPRRAYTGIWEMLSRGSFNGPGGPHSRWMIPPTGGASMGAQHMLRNRIDLQMVDEANVLRLSREALDDSGLVVADVRARVVQPESDELSGINVAFETGDRSPACDVATDPFCDGGSYDNYTIEVVDRMGADSFTPDSGVLLAKTKNSDARAPFGG